MSGPFVYGNLILNHVTIVAQ